MLKSRIDQCSDFLLKFQFMMVQLVGYFSFLVYALGRIENAQIKTPEISNNYLT